MKDYVKPSIRNSPDYFILHVGTNDLSSDKLPEEIARSITEKLIAFWGNCARRRTITLLTIPQESKEII